VEDQAHEPVVHLEKVASELASPVRHDIWDVHCADSRWRVITEPTNLYSQEDFRNWSELLANALASGESNAHLRLYCTPSSDMTTFMRPEDLV
jgi:hypothetical protein